jgi:hypothetical protein
MSAGIVLGLFLGLMVLGRVGASLDGRAGEVLCTISGLGLFAVWALLMLLAILSVK